MEGNHGRGTGQAGFTLVEVLLALTISGILFTAIFVTLDNAITTRNAVINAATPWIIGPAILDRMASDLDNAYLYDVKNNNAFYAVDYELRGSQADAMSFITASRTYAPELFGSTERDSFMNEVGYLVRTGAPGTPFLELWRREDFFVDDHPHTGGDYVLLCDKVASFQLQFVSRNPETKGGVAGPAQKELEQMVQDGWNSIQEEGLPRAVLVTLDIYAADDEKQVDRKAAEDGRTYRFQRYISLPQIHMSLQTERAITSWDGTQNEATTVVSGRNARDQQAIGGAGGRGGRGGGQSGGRGQSTRSRRGGGNQNAASNPFLQALQRAGGGRPAGGGGSNPFSGLLNH